AGLFNVITKKPTDEFTGFLQAELGELGHRRFEAAVGGPIVKGFLNFRVSGLSDERDGLVENTTAAVVPEALERMNGRDRKALRFQLGLPNVAGARINLSYEKVDLDLEATGWEFRRVTPRELAFFRQYDPNTDVDPENHVGSIDHDELGTRTLDTFVANASYDVGRWGLDAIVGYSVLDLLNRNDVDFTPAPMFWTESNDTNPQTSFELRLESPSLAGFLGLERLFGFGLGATEFTTGFFYLRRTLGDSSLAINLNAPVIGQFVLAQGIPTMLVTGTVPNMPIIPTGVPFPINADTVQVLLGPDAGIEQSTGFFEQTTNSAAGFGQMTWRFVERWKLEPGMRFTWESKKAEISRVFTKGTGIAFNAVAGQEEFDVEKQRSETALTPQVTLGHDWTDDISLYAKWAKGFKAGGFNELASVGTQGLEFKPEKVTAYEAGSKMRLLDGTASLNLGLFWNDAIDLQVFTLRPNDLVATVENVGKARARGVELDGSYLATSWLTVNGGFGFLDAKYLDFPFGECPMDRENTDGDGDPRCDLSGQPLYQAPKWKILLIPTVRFPIASLPLASRIPLVSGGGIDLVGGGSAEYVDVHFTTRSDDPRSRQPAYFRFNANVGLENVAQGWSLR
ncbi:MAG: TonB-dependent receptor, partial [Candidatus Binatia bacterium]